MKKLGIVTIVISAIVFCGYFFIHANNVAKANENVSIIKSEMSLAKIDSTELPTNSVKSNTQNVPEQLGYYYAEGQNYGTISFLDVESAIVVGTEADNLENSAMISSYSTEKAKVILGHQYKDGSVFGKLYLLKEGDEVVLTKMDGSKETYSVDETNWVSETEYETKEGTAEVFDKSADLKLISCMKQNGERGRTIVSLSLES